MSTVTTWETRSTSSEATEQLAAKLGAKLRGGEVIELVSDLGGGKTTFTRGLVRGTGSGEKVASPTFTISREYDIPPVLGRTFRKIAHFDFYRLGEAGVVADELAEVAGDPAYVVVVEWGEIARDVLPKSRVTVRLQLTGENSRQLIFEYPPELAYLLEGIK